MKINFLPHLAYLNSGQSIKQHLYNVTAVCRWWDSQHVTVTYVRPVCRWWDDHHMINCCVNSSLYLSSCYQHHGDAAAAADARPLARLLSLISADQQFSLRVLLMLRNSSVHSSTAHWHTATIISLLQFYWKVQLSCNNQLKSAAETITVHVTLSVYCFVHVFVRLHHYPYWVLHMHDVRPTGLQTLYDMRSELVS